MGKIYIYIWFNSWWVTYVRFSRRERREIAYIARMADAHDFYEVERPS